MTRSGGVRHAVPQWWRGLHKSSTVFENAWDRILLRLRKQLALHSLLRYISSGDQHPSFGTEGGEKGKFETYLSEKPNREESADNTNIGV